MPATKKNIRKSTNGKGYDLNLTEVIKVRITKEQARELKEFCKKNKTTTAQVVRLGIRNFIHAK